MDGNGPEDVHGSNDGRQPFLSFEDQPEIDQHERDVSRVENGVDGKEGGHVVEVEVHEEPPHLLGPSQVDHDKAHGPHHEQDPH